LQYSLDLLMMHELLFARVWTIVNGLGTFRPTRCCERKVSYRFEP
jgi:hypothetical protein